MTAAAVRGWTAAAALAGCSPSWVRRLVASGRLPFTKGADGSHVFASADLTAISTARTPPTSSSSPEPDSSPELGERVAGSGTNTPEGAEVGHPASSTTANPVLAGLDVAFAQIGQLNRAIESAALTETDLHRSGEVLAQSMAIFERRITSEITRRQAAEALLDARLAAIEATVARIPIAPLMTKYRCGACRVGTLAVPAACSICGYGSGVRSG